MKQSTIRLLANISVGGALLLSLVIGILPNTAALTSGEWAIMVSGLTMILSIFVVEAAVAVCAFVALSALDTGRWSLASVMALVLLPVALLWSGYNIKRGLDMAPAAVAERREALLDRAEGQEAQAAALRASVVASAAEGRYLNTDRIDRSIRDAERVAIEARTRAALMTSPHPVMLGFLALVIKMIELLLIFIATGVRGARKKEVAPSEVVPRSRVEPKPIKAKPELKVVAAADASAPADDLDAYIQARLNRKR